MAERIPAGFAARLPDGTLLTKDQQLDRMVTEQRAETVARALFPDDYHDGTDCRAEIGREGQPCSICAMQREAWLERVAKVREAVKEACGGGLNYGR